MDEDYTPLISLVGICVTFVVSVVSLALNIRNANKSDFITIVTKSRMNWMDALRVSISTFCSKVIRLHLTSPDKTETEARLNLIEDIQQLKHFIVLQLNRGDEYDAEIIKIIGRLSSLTPDKDLDRDLEIKRLMKKTQDLLKLEWEGIKEESKKGNLAESHKKDLYEKHLG